MDKTLAIKYTADATGVTKALGKVDAANASLGSRLKTAGAKVSSSFKVMGLGAVAFGVSSVKAYGDSQAAQVQLQNALANNPKLAGESAQSFLDLSKAIEAKTAADDESVVSGEAVLANFNLTGEQIRAITPLVVDYARKTGVDVPTAAEMLGKASLGNTRALKALGISYKTTGDHGTDFARITQLVRDKVGGFAEQEAQTTNGRLAQMRNRFNDLQEVVGQKVVEAFDLVSRHMRIFLPIAAAVAAVWVTSKIASFASSLKGIGDTFRSTGAKKDAFAKNVTGTLAPALKTGSSAFVGMATDALALGGPLLLLEGLMYTNKQRVDELSKAAANNQIQLGHSSEIAQVAAGSWRALAGQADGTTGSVKSSTSAVANNSGALSTNTDRLKTLAAEQATAKKTIPGFAAVFNTLSDAAASTSTKFQAAYNWIKKMEAEAIYALTHTPKVPQGIGSSSGHQVRAGGGPIDEHVIGIGMRTGRTWEFGEQGTEWVLPHGHGRGGQGGGTMNVQLVVNVAGSVLSDRRLVDVIHEQMLLLKRRSGGLGLS